MKFSVIFLIMERRTLLMKEGDERKFCLKSYPTPRSFLIHQIRGGVFYVGWNTQYYNCEMDLDECFVHNRTYYFFAQAEEDYKRNIKLHVTVYYSK